MIFVHCCCHEQVPVKLDISLRSFQPLLQPDTVRPLTKHRKIASSFRDTLLFEIFNMACKLLGQVRNHLSLKVWLNCWLYNCAKFCVCLLHSYDQKFDLFTVRPKICRIYFFPNFIFVYSIILQLQFLHCHILFLLQASKEGVDYNDENKVSLS